MPEIFNFEGNNPITIGNTEISCLKYADDLIIMSNSPISLQKCIKSLEMYCTKWKLEVNLKKTKIMIFNKQGSLIKKHKFFYQDKIIENKKEYKYLGFTFSCSGLDTIGINNLLGMQYNNFYQNQKTKKSKHTYISLILR